ncbi:hypothetical protein HID58_004860, partial [Brassica napus]
SQKQSSLGLSFKTRFDLRQSKMAATSEKQNGSKAPPLPSPLRNSKFLQSNMRILISGGAGFIGSHLVDKLMENEKNEVVVADNYFTGSKENLKKWIGHPRFELIRHDVTEPLLLEVDRIYHLACPASPIFYKYNPVKVCARRIYIIVSLLEAGPALRFWGHDLLKILN